jgi:hypothetical protein
MTLTDNQAGICIPGDCGSYNSSQTQLRLDAPSGDQRIYFTSFTRTSGSDTNGTYVATADLPRYSTAGVWSAGSLLLVDKLGNYQHVDNSYLESHFGSGISDVNNTAAIYDNTDPTITAFSLSPTTINTDTEDQTVTLSVTLTDNLVGVCISGDCSNYNSSPTQLRLKAPSGGQTVDFYDFTRTSGDANNGTYTASAVIPSGSTSGVWSADYFLLVDKLGNYQHVDNSYLESHFGSGISDVNNTAATHDNTAPDVTAFEITPTEMNTSDVSQTLTLNLTLTDDQVGVCTSGDCGNYNSSPTQLRLSPLIGTQFIDFYDFTRTSGDANNGTYTTTVTIPQGSKEGIWQVEHLLLVDKLGNVEYLYANDLNTLFPDAEGLTIANTAEASSVTIEREWIISSENSSVTFSAGTVVTKEAGGNFAFYKMINEEFSIEEEYIKGIPILAIRFGIPGLNLRFSQNATVVFNVGSEYEGEVLQIQSRKESAESWANETECTVSNAQCSFTVDHATYLAATFKVDPKILTTSGPGEVTRLWAYDRHGNATDVKIESDLFPSSYTGGAGIVAIDQNNNHVSNQFLLFPISNGGPQARVMGLRKDGSITLKGQMFLFQAPGDASGTSSIRDGLSMTVGDFDNDGYDDDVAACLTGEYKPHIKVFKDATGIDNWELINQFDAPFGAVGCNLGTFQYDDGAPEILVTPHYGPAEPYVYIYTVGGTLKKQFKAYDDPINQGLTATSINDRIYTTPNNGSSHIRAFDSDGNPKNFWWVYASHVRGDFTIRAGDIDLDGKDELITSPIGANGPHILSFESTNKWRTWPNFFAFGDETLRNGVGIAVIENWHGIN